MPRLRATGLLRAAGRDKKDEGRAPPWLLAVLALLLAVLLALAWLPPGGPPPSTSPPLPPAAEDEDPLRAGERLLRGGRAAAALPLLEAALDRAPHSPRVLAAAGDAALAAGAPARAAAVFAHLAEITLRVPAGAWAAVRRQLASAPAEELEWLRTALGSGRDGDAPRKVLRRLLASYLAGRDLPAAAELFAVLARLNPEDVALQRRHALFAAGTGRLADAADILVATAQSQYTAAHPRTDAANHVRGAAVAMVSHALDAFALEFIRSLLLVRDATELDYIGRACNLSLAHIWDTTSTVTLRTAVTTLGACLTHQRVVASAVALGATVGPPSLHTFGLLPPHFAARFGDLPLVALLYSFGESPELLQATSSLGHTALHAAVIRGHAHLIPLLLELGVDPAIQDLGHRTAFEIACALPYYQNLPNVFPGKSTSECPPPVLSPSIAPFNAVDSSGWLASNHFRDELPVPSGDGGCDFDIRENITPQVFLVEYLSLDKPVLVRGATTGSLWDNLRQRWSRSSFARNFGHLTFPAGSIPYSSAFGSEENQTTIAKFLKYMEEVTLASAEGFETWQSAPQYIFSRIPAKSPLLADVALPDFADPSVTELEAQVPQLFLGPPGSGAPPHIHQAALNVLVFGEKYWSLIPPAEAIYSTTPALPWFREDLQTTQSNTLRCIQRAGDVLFVPPMWSHATLNLDESVGFSTELEWGQLILD